jgi:hypothetical protein
LQLLHDISVESSAQPGSQEGLYSSPKIVDTSP